MAGNPFHQGGTEVDIAECLAHSDLGPELETYVAIFRRAHESKPGGPSLEIGTRGGGSALAILRILEETYPDPPFLFTVDPYGEKPYPISGVDPTTYVYGSQFYVEQKHLLAPFPNHAHFLMRGEDFLDKVAGTSYWWRGEERKIGGFSLVFLDGDHSSATLLLTLRLLFAHMAHGGVILIDNANWDGDIVGDILDTGPYKLRAYGGRTCLLTR